MGRLIIEGEPPHRRVDAGPHKRPLTHRWAARGDRPSGRTRTVPIGPIQGCKGEVPGTGAIWMFWFLSFGGFGHCTLFGVCFWMFESWGEMAINIGLLPKHCHGLQSSLRVCWAKGLLFVLRGGVCPLYFWFFERVVRRVSKRHVDIRGNSM